ncbi:MAG: phosphoglyceromutase [Acidimicrobiia bacterium]|nr:phosphoglyceromutase [Acidimicrobiia bacterium]
MSTLVLMRHGESEWNLANLFTGWVDADLSERGRAEASAGGRALQDAGLLVDVVHTSVLVRAIRTAQLALDELGRAWVPVRRSWRLNERHYGDLTGLDKKATAERYGTDQVHIWRRSYDVPPPPIDPANPHNPNADPRYRALAPDVVPAAECLKDVVERMLPYWYDEIVPDLRAGLVVLVAAHGNSLRALVKHLDGIGDDEISELNLPTGVPLLYELDDGLRPQHPAHPLERVVGDPEAARAAAAAVARQAG